MYKRIIIFIIFIISIVISSINVKSYDFNSPKTIKVEIKGEVNSPGIYDVELGSTLSNLLEKAKLNEYADTSRLSLLHVLRNNEVIVIPKNNYENLISINTANIYELSVLPGIGKSTAIKIVEYRNTYGSFNNLEDLKNVSGIGDRKYERIKQYICL